MKTWHVLTILAVAAVVLGFGSQTALAQQYIFDPATGQIYIIPTQPGYYVQEFPQTQFRYVPRPVPTNNLPIWQYDNTMASNFYQAYGGTSGMLSRGYTEQQTTQARIKHEYTRKLQKNRAYQLCVATYKVYSCKDLLD